MDNVKVKIITEEDEDYPKRLLAMANHPKELYVLGDSKLLNKDSIAIVGSRNCDEYGREQTERFARFLAQKNICIVSGLAVGTDTVAHETSIEEVGKTIAVVASGFEHIYPDQNQKLFYKIIENGGCIVSEYPPETEVEMSRFPKRNKIIVGISVATLVVEAAQKCGSTITGRETLKQGKALFCIPGDIDAVLSARTNLLISEGAYLTTTPYDILDVLEYEGYSYENAESMKDRCRVVYKSLQTKAKTIDEIAVDTKINIIDVGEMLFLLEMDNFVVNENGYYKIKENRRRRRKSNV